MTSIVRTEIWWPADLHAACVRAAGDTPLNEWIRERLARAVKRPDLAAMRGRGRPKKR